MNPSKMVMAAAAMFMFGLTLCMACSATNHSSPSETFSGEQSSAQSPPAAPCNEYCRAFRAVLAARDNGFESIASKRPSDQEDAPAKLALPGATKCVVSQQRVYRCAFPGVISGDRSTAVLVDKLNTVAYDVNVSLPPGWTQELVFDSETMLRTFEYFAPGTVSGDRTTARPAGSPAVMVSMALLKPSIITLEIYAANSVPVAAKPKPETDAQQPPTHTKEAIKVPRPSGRLVTAICSVDNAEVASGELVKATASGLNFKRGHALNYSWSTNGGRVTGSGESVTIDTSGIPGGLRYDVSVFVTDAKEKTTGAACETSFTTKR
jgi:hypothetical protein